MTNYPRTAYGSSNPNAGRPANGEFVAWGGYCWPAGVPSNLLRQTNYLSRASGQRLVTTLRAELVPIWNLVYEFMDRVHKYPVYAERNGQPWGPWGYSNRPVSGTDYPSGHSAALSNDINAPLNPYSFTWQCDMPPAMVLAIENLGFYWGGRYSGSTPYDPMHFGYCLKPSDVTDSLRKALLLVVPTPKGNSMTAFTSVRTPDGVGFALSDRNVEGLPSMGDYDKFRSLGLIPDRPFTECPEVPRDVIKWYANKVSQWPGGTVYGI